jgi:hypothetical protein
MPEAMSTKKNRKKTDTKKKAFQQKWVPAGESG